MDDRLGSMPGVGCVRLGICCLQNFINDYSNALLGGPWWQSGNITTGSWKGRGNQYIQFVRVLYCKLPTNGKQLPAFPFEAVPGTEPRPQRWRQECYHSATVAPDWEAWGGGEKYTGVVGNTLDPHLSCPRFALVPDIK